VNGSAPSPSPPESAASPRSPSTDVALELRGVDAGYGPFRALFDVSFGVPKGGVCALLGPNGAGKTTVARVASGLIAPTSGTVWVSSTNVTGQPAWKLARLGVAHAVEGRSVFASLSVEDNLRLSFRRSVGAGGLNDALQRAYARFPRLGERRLQIAGTLSGGEQRMLALARVLADPPMVLIADELSLGLAPVIVDEVYATLATIRDAGTSLLIVEQQVPRAIELADVVVVLGKGAVRYAGPASDIGDLVEELLPTT
jgi:branched-chain amino acid transport system ATP-binding protein